VSYLETISFHDRKRLRDIVKKVHLSKYPTEFINNYEADKVIESFAPKVVEKMLKQFVDSRFD
jgi:hypothetical protein